MKRKVNIQDIANALNISRNTVSKAINGTGNVERAVYYLEKKGVEFDFSTAKYKGERLTSVYLTDCIGGFAIHLVEK